MAKGLVLEFKRTPFESVRFSVTNYHELIVNFTTNDSCDSSDSCSVLHHEFHQSHEYSLRYNRLPLIHGRMLCAL